jgi:hypothetical protein
MQVRLTTLITLVSDGRSGFVLSMSTVTHRMFHERHLRMAIS